MSGLISPMASGQPGWLAWTCNRAASALSHQGLAASAVLAAALIVVALGVAGRPCHARPCCRRGRGHLVRRGAAASSPARGTDPNPGPLLAFLALAYWRARTLAPASPQPEHPALMRGA